LIKPERFHAWYYLAQAQQEQIAELQSSLQTLTAFQPKDFTIDDEIALGALVEVENEGDLSFYFLAPSGGGLTIDYLGCELTVITPEAQLFQELMGCRLGDSLSSPPLLVMGIE